jgi:glycosyltransferase involved in cell wall biosynthesis
MGVIAMKLKWVGPVGTGSGYGIASINYIEALNSLGADMKVVSLDGTFFAPWMSQTKKKDDEGRITIRHALPDIPADVYYTVFEFDRAPEQWRPILEKARLVFTPSKFSKDSLSTICDEDKIKVIPHGIGEEFNPLGPKGEINLKPTEDWKEDMRLPSFKFLSVFEWVKRKCPERMIQAFREEFSPDEDVCLILKTYHHQKDVRKKIKQLAGDANIFHLRQKFEDMSVLYRSVDAYVSATGGEGWGETLSEAMACGLPTIGCNNGGNMEFMDLFNSWISPSEGWQPIGYNNLEAIIKPWFKYRPPCVPSLRETMRNVYEAATKNTKIHKGKINNAMKIGNKFTWEKAAKLMLKYLEEEFGD